MTDFYAKRIPYRITLQAASDSSLLIRLWNILMFAPRYVLFGRTWL